MSTDNNTHIDDDITKVDADGNTKLHKAVLDNNPEQLKELLTNETLNVNEKNILSECALQIASKYANTECIKILLAHKDINSGDFVIKENQHIHQAEYVSLSDILQGILNCETFNDFTQIPHESFHLFMP